MTTATTAKATPQRLETTGFVLGFIGVLIFSFTLPLTRIAVRDLDPTFVGLGRALIAAALSAGLLLITRQPLPGRANLPGLALTALGVVIGFPLFSAWASRFIEASHSAIVNALLPLATAALSVAVSGDRPSPRFWVAALVGSLTVIVYILFASGEALNIGDLAMLGAVAIGSVGYVAGGRMSRRIGSWQTICWANVLAAPALLVPVWLSRPADSAVVPTEAWLSFGYLGAFSMFLGFVFWYRGMTLAGITRISQVQLIQALLTITWSTLILGEHITVWMLLALAVVVAMIIVVRNAPIRTAPQSR
jgi:drug/metabolite transporter (DMT)-like permease